MDKSIVEILQNFEAFSEYMNFKRECFVMPNFSILDKIGLKSCEHYTCALCAYQIIDIAFNTYT